VLSARARQGHERQFRRLFNTSTVPMVLVDSTRNFLDANQAARLLFRLSLDEFRRRRIDDLTPFHMFDGLNARWSDLQTVGHVCGSYDVMLPDASRLPITYCALANALPGEHLIVFVPAAWRDDELGFLDDSDDSTSAGPLTMRERQVLTLIATGADFGEIADELSIARTTVKTHAQNALRKLGARNRPHAIALAMRDGLISAPPRPDEQPPKELPGEER
jgi:DNA-binding CsgD family transcriptional regulator